MPAPLVAVAAGIGLTVLADLPDHGVALIAPVPSGLPAPVAPSTSHVSVLLPGAIAIALMAYLETVSVARSVRRPEEPGIDSNAEMVANGTAAVAGAFVQAMPPAGGFSQTAVNQRAGSRTQASELVTVVLAVAAALFLGPVLDDLAEATLGSLVIVAVIGLIKPREVAFLARFDRPELLVAVITAAVGLTAGLLQAVAVGVVANLLLVLHELNHPDVDELRLTRDGDLAPDGHTTVDGLLVLRIGAPTPHRATRDESRPPIASEPARAGKRPVPRAREGADAMSLPEIATRDRWLAARIDLLAKEKELTRQRDALNVERRNLPMVEVDKPYEFDGPGGKVSLHDMFEGRKQLLIYHFMFDPEWDEGCSSCTAGTDELSDGFFDHLHTRDTTYAMVSRAPLEKLEAWKARRGWTMPWYSSFGSDFNYDWGVSLDESVTPVVYNYRTKAEHEARSGEPGSFDEPFEAPGLSCFLDVDGRVFHTYSTFARGLESTGGSYYFLDLTALGRQEDWEEPKGRTDSVRGNRPDFAS